MKFRVKSYEVVYEYYSSLGWIDEVKDSKEERKYNSTNKVDFKMKSFKYMLLKQENVFN